MSQSLKMNSERLIKTINDLGKVGGLEGGGCARLALTDEDKQGRDLVMGWMKDLGLEVTMDELGNVGVYFIERGTTMHSNISDVFKDASQQSSWLIPARMSMIYFNGRKLM